MPTLTSPPAPPPPAAPLARVTECFDCGQFHLVAPLPPRAEARCLRCAAVLHRTRTDPLHRALAWCLAALATYVIAVLLPFMRIDLYGRTRDVMLASGPRQFDRDGMIELAILVGLFTIGVPLVRLLSMAWVLIAPRLPNPPRYLHVVLRLVGTLRVWSMVEVYMLGVFVAYTKLIDIAHVEILAAGYALGALMMLQAGAEANFDREAVWQSLEQRGLVHDPARLATTLEILAHGQVPPDRLIGCPHCAFTINAPSGAICPRCGGRAFARKPNAVARCWALLIAAAILYIPANLLPILTVSEFGTGSPSTILSGVGELARDGMWPLAILVFFASITLPAVKLISLVFVLITTRRRARGQLRGRTTLFRVIEVIGRWSMIDMFMLSVLVGLVRLGFVASVVPNAGATAFVSVVVLTMLASMAFDPRLMWDAAAEQKT
jgi:paraquat-inducible protein A